MPEVVPKVMEAIDAISMQFWNAVQQQHNLNALLPVSAVVELLLQCR
jgi:hypothetical protein